MDKLITGYRSAASNGPTAADWVAVLQEDFPHITKILIGTYDEGTKTYDLPPLSVIIFDDKGVLKFCLGKKGLSRCFFGTVDDPSKVLESINTAIAEGRGEWKNKRG